MSLVNAIQLYLTDGCLLYPVYSDPSFKLLLLHLKLILTKKAEKNKQIKFHPRKHEMVP